MMPGKHDKVKVKADKPFLEEEEKSAFAKASEGKPNGKGKKAKAKVAKKTAKVTEKTTTVTETTDEVQETPEEGETPIMPLTLEKLRFLR